MNRHETSRCTPLESWPEEDRRLWKQALAPADPFDPSAGYAQRWAATTRAGIVNGYGRWLGWLGRSGQLDPATRPGERATEARVREYLDALRAGGLADNTCAGRLQQLCNALRAMESSRDWSWLHRASSRIYSKAVLVRDPVERMQPANDVIQLGRDLMHAAVHDRFRSPSDRAVLYRDGLMIALLVRRPFRMANFSTITLGRHMTEQGGGWRLRFEEEATKSRQVIDCAWPEELLQDLRVYLNTHRPTLLRSVTSPGKVHALWIAKGGRAMGSAAIEFQIRDRTEEAFGRSINPHTFRHIAATTIATCNPDGALDIKNVLSHASIATSEKHYNRATMLGASASYQQALAQFRSG